MSFEPHRPSIGGRENARRVEPEPLMEPSPESGSDTPIRNAGAAGSISMGRGVHGFKLSARVGRPFRFEPGAPTAPGEAKPATGPEAPMSAPGMEIRKAAKPHYEKLVNDAARKKEQASENTAGPVFTAFPGFLFRALFRRRTDRNQRES